MQPDFSHENLHKNLIILGCDEAGRGPIAGPVVAAVALLNKNDFPLEINDSKKLTKRKRKNIFEELKKKSKFGVGIVDEKTIDKINILEGSKLAMLYAYRDFVEKYKIFPEVILVDGNFIPFQREGKISQIIPIVKGDSKSLSIAAASIIAKEVRDEIMNQFHEEYSQFGFNKHAGYPTKFHIEAVKKFGICKIHRKSFEPIKSILQTAK